MTPFADCEAIPSLESSSVVENTQLGDYTVIRKFCNIYNSTIGKHCKIASYVEIGGAVIGDHCKIEAFTFIPPGVTLGNHVFVGPHVAFTNDKHPSTRVPFTPNPTVVEDNVVIGANSTILSGLRIGEGAQIGAGSVVTHDVSPRVILYGPNAQERGTVH